MNIIKQVLIRLSQKESIRTIAAALHINKNTVSRYKSISEADPMPLRELLALEDTVQTIVSTAAIRPTATGAWRCSRGFFLIWRQNLRSPT